MIKKIMVLLIAASLLTGCAEIIPEPPTDEIILNATHLSFIVDDNTVTFHNYSFELKGYLNQSDYLWSDGFAPNMGNATLYTPDYSYDITIDYVILYREWTGKE